MDLLKAAKYPFLEDSKKVLRNFSFKDVELELMEEAKERLSSILKEELKPNSIKYESLTEEGLLKEIKLYVLIKILAFLSKNLKSFAGFEAKRVFHNLQSEQDDFLLKLTKAKKDGEYYVINIFEYLESSPQLPEDSISLFPIKDGKIYLTRTQFLRYISRNYELSILQFKPSLKDIPRTMVELSKDLSQMRETLKLPARIYSEYFPPCINAAITELQKEKIPHMQRFILGTFLAGINYPLEKAVSLFRNSPGFDEKKTRYHLEFIYGSKSSGKKYFVPNCSKIKELGFCRKNAECKYKNPITFYLKKVGKHGHKKLHEEKVL